MVYASVDSKLWSALDAHFESNDLRVHWDLIIPGLSH